MMWVIFACVDGFKRLHNIIFALILLKKAINIYICAVVLIKNYQP